MTSRVSHPPSASSIPASLPGRWDRLLAVAGADRALVARTKATAFRQMLVGLVVVEFWDSVARRADDPSVRVFLLLAVLSTLGAPFAWSERWHRFGLIAVGACVAAQVVLTFPGTANHHYLLLLCFVLLSVLRTAVDEEVCRLTVTLRWMLLIALFYAGAQKLAWGYYFQGEFLAFTVAESGRFAALLEPLIPAAEFARLSALQVGEGAGPYRVSSVLFVLASNVAYLAELVLPALLLLPALRKPGVVLVILYFVAIEAAAREVFFGGVMVALTLLFYSDSALRRARPAFVLALAYLLAMAAGLLPRWEFT
jgi:hypothetical protein